MDWIRLRKDESNEVDDSVKVPCLFGKDGEGKEKRKLKE